jgi:hypothetical protein
MHPHGYWAAEGQLPNSKSTDFDGTGSTPLDAVMDLGRQMLEHIHQQEGGKE